MHGVGGISVAEGATRTAARQKGSQFTPAALENSRKEIAKALGSTGFVYVVGPSDQNFQTYLTREPFEIKVGELKPGTLEDLAEWVATEVTKNPDEAVETQANVEPKRAVTLLT